MDDKNYRVSDSNTLEPLVVFTDISRRNSGSSGFSIFSSELKLNEPLVTLPLYFKNRLQPLPNVLRLFPIDARGFRPILTSVSNKGARLIML